MLTFCFNDEDEAKASILGYQKYLSQWWDFEVHVSEVQEITAPVSFQSSRLFESEDATAELVTGLVSTRHIGFHRIHHPLGSFACPALSSSLRHTCRSAGTKMQMRSQGGTIVAGGIQNSDQLTSCKAQFSCACYTAYILQLRHSIPRLVAQLCPGHASWPKIIRKPSPASKLKV